MMVHARCVIIWDALAQIVLAILSGQAAEHFLLPHLPEPLAIMHALVQLTAQ